MKKKFTSIKFASKTLDVIENANRIIEDYTAQGLRLTLRQLYYQFVSKNWIANNDKSYKRLANIISDGRLAGLVDWSAIEDRGRIPDVPAEWSNVAGILEAAIYSYRRRRWADQPNVVELWVEKQALAGVLEPLAREFHVVLSVNKGYSSQSAMFEAAERISRRAVTKGDIKKPYVLYLGDHDPSGEDMVRDISERLNMFKSNGLPKIIVEKIALTMTQIEKYNPPPNPAKKTDVRFKKYAEKHGTESWEVDALPPNILQQIIRNRIEQLVDRARMDNVIAQENVEKSAMQDLVSRFSENSDSEDGVDPDDSGDENNSDDDENEDEDDGDGESDDGLHYGPTKYTAADGMETAFWGEHHLRVLLRVGDCIDGLGGYDKADGILDPSTMRCDDRIHPRECAWSHSHAPTIMWNGFIGEPHDDWSCLDDLISRKYVSIESSEDTDVFDRVYALTKAGRREVEALRRHLNDHDNFRHYLVVANQS